MVVTLEEKQKKLEQQRANLLQKAQRLKATARKAETRKLIQMGQLIKNADLTDLDEQALIGGLQLLKDLSNNEETIKEWKERAQALSSSDPTEAIVVSFSFPPPNELQAELKKAGLKWNHFRQEWQGFAVFENIEQILSKAQATIERVEKNR